MMKPININMKDGSKTTSASNTIWDGPDIPCLDLCKGDTIDKVVYDLALKVCKKFEELDPDSYNLECLDLTGCDTITFQQLIQILIDRSCEQEEDTGSNEDCCDQYCTIKVSMNVSDISFPNPIPQNPTVDPYIRTLSTTITGGSGNYQYLWSFADTTPSHTIHSGSLTDPTIVILQVSSDLGQGKLFSMIKVTITDIDTGCTAEDYKIIALVQN